MFYTHSVVNREQKFQQRLVEITYSLKLDWQYDMSELNEFRLFIMSRNSILIFPLCISLSRFNKFWINAQFLKRKSELVNILLKVFDIKKTF